LGIGHGADVGGLAQSFEIQVYHTIVLGNKAVLSFLDFELISDFPGQWVHELHALPLNHALA